MRENIGLFSHMTHSLYTHRLRVLEDLFTLYDSICTRCWNAREMKTHFPFGSFETAAYFGEYEAR